MDRICESTLAVARHLERHPKVEWVRYAGLEDSPHEPLLDKYMNGKGSGILSFGTQGGQEVGVKFLNALKLITRRVPTYEILRGNKRRPLAQAAERIEHQRHEQMK